MSRRARTRANARPWESGETPEPEDDQPEQWEDEPTEPTRCPNTGDMFSND
jgi:hypothetical protein